MLLRDSLSISVGAFSISLNQYLGMTSVVLPLLCCCFCLFDSASTDSTLSNLELQEGDEPKKKATRQQQQRSKHEGGQR